MLTKKQILDGNMGMLALLSELLGRPLWQAAGEAKAMEAFVQVTSPDPAHPLRGSDLWVLLKDKFRTAEGGIDLDRISREMAEQTMKSLFG